MLEVRVLGRFELRLDGASVLLPSRPAQSLLAYLALSAGAAHRRERLAGLLWPDADDDNARNSLRHALWRIRKSIEPDNSATYLLTDELSVAFNAASDFWLDAAVLTRDGGSLQDQLDAVAVYQGELLPGFYDDWITLERDRLESIFQHRMQRLLDALIEERRWAQVVEWAERWVALGHAPEPGYRALMRAHAELGNRSRVAAVFQRCREALFNELGVQPSIQTRRLYERLCNEDAAPETEVPPRTIPDEAPVPGDPPFQGLHYFDEADADRFFGRERLTQRLLLRAQTESFLAIIGASGSGKSSVVRAGLIPALRRAADTNEVFVFTPTSHPLDSLAASLVSEHDRARLLEEMRRDPSGLRRFFQVERRKPLTIIVDQFEELFTLCDNTFEREVLAENLISAAEQDSPASVVIALRADFYAHCAEYSSLRDAVAQHQEYVGALNAAELRRAIEAPARAGGWAIEPGLVELLLRDVGEEPGALPLLSHALLETWRRRRGRELTLRGYTSSGGVQGAIAQTADTVYTQRLTVEQQAIARHIFLRLTELGEGTQDTRRRATFDELTRHVEEVDVREVLGLLADARLVAVDGNSVEVAHEALIREWTRLREWLNQDRESLRVQRRLNASASEWQRLGGDTGSLYRGAQLSQALEWFQMHSAELGPVDRSFLDASQQLAATEIAQREAQRERDLEAARQLAEAERQRAQDQQRAAVKLRQRAVLLSVAFAIALVMAATAVFFGDTARHQAIRAEADARAAVSRELAAGALTNLTVDPERAALLALRALDATYLVDGTWTREAEDALHRVVPLLRAQHTLLGHTGKVLSVAFSPDGRQVATASQDATARVWDAVTGDPRFTLAGHAGPVNAVAFSPDNRLIATASDDRTAVIWDAYTGQRRKLLAGFNREVERLVFSPDAGRLATTSLDGDVNIWETETGRNLQTFHPGRAVESPVAIGVAFSPDGTQLATVTPDGEIDEWDLAADPPHLARTRVASDSGALAHTVAYSPDGTRIGMTTDTGAQFWWTNTGTPSLSIVGHDIQTTDTAFSPDGTDVATSSLDHTARLWDSRTGREVLSLAGHDDAISQVAFSPDSRRLATASWDGTAKIWDLDPAHEVLTFLANGALVTYAARLADAPLAGPVAVSSDGAWLLTGLWNATATLVEAQTGHELLTLRGHASQVLGTAISQNRLRLATGSTDRTVRVWDAHTGNALWIGTGHTDRVVALSFSPDGEQLASAGSDRRVIVWDATTGDQLFSLTNPNAAFTHVVFSPDGTQIATSSDSPVDNVRIWSAATGELLRTFNGSHDPIWSVAYNADGTRLVSASRDGSAYIWDVHGGQPIRTLQTNAGTLVDAAFSPDGSQLATASRNGTVEVWNLATSQEILSLTTSELGDGVDSIVFAPDGRQLIVRTDRSVRTFALKIEDLRALAQSRVTRPLTEVECQRFLHLDQCPSTSGWADSASGSLRQIADTQVQAVAPTLAVPAPGITLGAGLTGTIKIISSMSRSGTNMAQSDMVINAYRMAIADHHDRIGNATLVLEDLNDSSASQGYWDRPTETGIANQAINDPQVLVYLGPNLSAPARISIPILCTAQLAMISYSATYPGLTKQTPYNGAGEPDVYYPNCQRNFARVVPSDELQGAAAAQFAKEKGVHTAYVIHDGGVYGQGLAAVFAATATKLGIDVVGGPEGMDPSAHDYKPLVDKVRLAHPDLVYFGGIDANNAGRLWQDLRAGLGTQVMLIGGDGISTNGFLQQTGAAAEGTYASFPGVPASRLTGRGAEWYQRYKQEFGEEPLPYAAYGYEAMSVALAAIEQVGRKDRAAIRDAILATHDFHGALGQWSFTYTGDTTLTTMSFRQVRNGAWDPGTVEVIEAPHPLQ